jgi:hypothetical protein
MDIIESIANGFIIVYVLVIFKKMSDRNSKK